MQHVARNETANAALVGVNPVPKVRYRKLAKLFKQSNLMTRFSYIDFSFESSKKNLGLPHQINWYNLLFIVKQNT